MEKPIFERVVDVTASTAQNVGGFLLGLTKIPGIVSTLRTINTMPLMQPDAFEDAVNRRTEKVIAEHLNR